MDDHGDQLLFQALLFDREVDEGHLARDLGLVLRVRELGGQVEPEVGVVGDLLLA